jgi:hypothetical protein
MEGFFSGDNTNSGDTKTHLNHAQALFVGGGFSYSTAASAAIAPAKWHTSCAVHPRRRGQRGFHNQKVRVGKI